MTFTTAAPRPPVDRQSGTRLGSVTPIRVGQVALVDRVVELARLQADLITAFAGSPQAVFLTGEAGIGKSRLVRETITLARATAASTAILHGRCLDEQGMPPYLPWLDAFADVDRADRESPAETRALLPLLAGSEHLPGTTLVDPEQRKLKLFNAVTRAITDIAATRPVVIAFDDLQWSDAASNELLRFLLLHAPPVPLLVLGAYRAEEAAANTALLRTVTELERHRLLTLLPVSPLALSDTWQLVSGLTSADLACQPLAEAVHRHCEGNPFFVEEVVRALADDDRLFGALPIGNVPLPLPRGVTAVIERRLGRVDEGCRAVLETAALIGLRIPVDLVAAATGLEPITVADHLDAAARAALVRPLTTDEIDSAEIAFPADFAFLHDRVRETIAARTNAVRRRTLHGRIADTLLVADRGHDLIWLAQVTHHCHLARRSDAARLAIRFGQAAMRAHAHTEAARAYRLAVELAPAASDLDGITQAELLLRLGEASLAAGESDAVDALRRAEELFFAAGDRPAMARARRSLGAAHARREEFEQAVGYLEGALTLFPAAPSTNAAIANPQEPEIAGVLVDLGSIKGLSLGQYPEAIAVSRTALTLAARHTATHPALEALARLGLANALMRSGRLTEGATLLRPGLERAQSSGDLNLAAEIAGALANYHYWIGDLGGSERAARLRCELASRGGDPYALRHGVPWLAFIAASRGDWDAAERLLLEGEAHVARVESPEPRAFLGKIRGFTLLMRGRYVEAIAELETAIAGFRQSGPGTLVWYLGCLGTAHAAASNSAASAAIAAETADLIDALPAGALPRGAAVAELGIAACLRSDRVEAARWYPQLLPHAGQFHWVLIDRVLGMLAALLDDLPTAERHFAAAAATARRNGIRPELALTLAEHGLARRRSADIGESAGVEPLLHEAHGLLQELGMEADLARVDGVLADPFNSVPLRDGTVRGSTALPAGLSEREVEVLSLVAQGLTNREIGEQLSISAKTVTNHLTHVFTKADLDNRAAAVAFALRHGLA